MDYQKGLSIDLNELPRREYDNTGLLKNGRTCENPNIYFPINNDKMKASKTVNMVGCESPLVEREEGEWSDIDESASSCEIYTESSKRSTKFTKVLQNHNVIELKNHSSSSISTNKCYSCVKVDSAIRDHTTDHDFNVEKCTNSDVKITGRGELVLDPKNNDTKGVEKANNFVRNSQRDLQKEAMLGKKRNRQTMFLNLEDVKQVVPAKNPALKRQNNQFPAISRTVRELHTLPPHAPHAGEKPCILSDIKADESSNEGLLHTELCESEPENIGGMNSGFTQKLQNFSSTSDTLPSSKHESRKPQSESRYLKNSTVSKRKPFANSQSTVEIKQGSRNHLTPKNHFSVVSQCQDTSVERLIREVTSEMFSPHPRVTDLQQLPGSFESVEEYISAFEPLLFEECRAQFFNSWEEQKEGSSRDMHVMVRIKWIERRERGWHDVVLVPVNVCKWKFKEGDVAVLSSPKPGAGRSKRVVNHTILDSNGDKVEIKGRIAGTVRRHSSNDFGEPPGAILHFFVGDSNNPNSGGDADNLLCMLEPNTLWHLTILGSLATTQREYIALHAFRRLNDQMQAAILRPGPDLFPKYQDADPPPMHECFTPNFVEHLRRTFNPPQLSAIHWAAMHTSAGTIPSLKKQDPWPFTLVQGPPGTGKTHTVWGMLNVIHLVQYQHYYTSLLKKLAPDSYTSGSVSGSGSGSGFGSGSIDDLLNTMDQTLLRTLPTLCPKPRILVCAPSNAATDELLSRVLDRGFIDGEMKVYRPDVARVGVDSQNRAAQAVSVERRADQLLMKTRDEVHGWLHQLRGREVHLSHQMALLQKSLLSAASSGREEGSLGVDPAVLAARDQARDGLLQSLAAVVEERDKVLVDISRLLILEGRFSRRSRNTDDIKSDLEVSFADEAEVVFTTVSSSGRRLFSRLAHGFDMVVIDEAAQASEVSVLPPLSLGAARCVLVGDPQQLPATVISRSADTLLYSRSLLERFQQAGCPTLLLSVQYRMHPHIREFPSRYFYHGRLADSDSVRDSPDEPYHGDPLLKPFLFYDVAHGRESHRAGSVSYQNVDEARFCRRLFELLRSRLARSGEGGASVTVGIITPYKLQLRCLEREFGETVEGEDEELKPYINTVDAFQGQERDVIIMSCVRASGRGGVGFVADVRRMNVALTRARRALWVAGNAAALARSDDWAALIADAKSRGCFLRMEAVQKQLLQEDQSPVHANWRR